LELIEGAVEDVGADRLACFDALAQVEEHGGRGECGERHLLDRGAAVVEVVGHVDVGAGVRVQCDCLGVESLGFAAVVVGEVRRVILGPGGAVVADGLAEVPDAVGADQEAHARLSTGRVLAGSIRFAPRRSARRDARAMIVSAGLADPWVGMTLPSQTNRLGISQARWSRSMTPVSGLSDMGQPPTRWA
jgi:hypothetical protein